MISHYETVLSADVDSTDVAIDLDRDGYEHNFTLQYIKTCHVTPSPVIEETFAFGIVFEANTMLPFVKFRFYR